MSIVTIETGENRLPVIRLDGKDYFITGGSYTKLHNEKAFLSEEYTASGGISLSFVRTYKHRWTMTLRVPLANSQVNIPDDMTWLTPGDMTYLHDLHARVPPSNLIEFYDVLCNQDFSGTYSHLVYLNIGQEIPFKDSIKIWDVPITLWGYDAP